MTAPATAASASFVCPATLVVANRLRSRSRRQPAQGPGQHVDGDRVPGTRTPARSALVSDDPIASVCRPNRVNRITAQSTKHEHTHDQRRAAGRPRRPSHPGCPAARSAGRRGRRRCVMMKAIPAPMPVVPSVAMNEFTSSRVTIRPFTSPKVAPVADAGGDPSTSARARCGYSPAWISSRRPADVLDHLAADDRRQHEHRAERDVDLPRCELERGRDREQHDLRRVEADVLQADQAEEEVVRRQQPEDQDEQRRRRRHHERRVRDLSRSLALTARRSPTIAWTTSVIVSSRAGRFEDDLAPAQDRRPCRPPPASAGCRAR